MIYDKYMGISNFEKKAFQRERNNVFGMLLRRNTALHLRKHTCYAFPFVLIISHIFGASSGTSYRKRSPRGAFAQVEPRRFVPRVVKLTADLTRDERERNEVAARGWVLIKNRYITPISGSATADNNKPSGLISSRLFGPRLG